MHEETTVESTPTIGDYAFSDPNDLVPLGISSHTSVLCLDVPSLFSDAISDLGCVIRMASVSDDVLPTTTRFDVVLVWLWTTPEDMSRLMERLAPVLAPRVRLWFMLWKSTSQHPDAPAVEDRLKLQGLREMLFDLPYGLAAKNTYSLGEHHYGVQYVRRKDWLAGHVDDDEIVD